MNRFSAGVVGRPLFDQIEVYAPDLVALINRMALQLPAQLRRRLVAAAFDRAEAAFNRGDFEPICALFTANAEYVPPPAVHNRQPIVGLSWRLCTGSAVITLMLVMNWTSISGSFLSRGFARSRRRSETSRPLLRAPSRRRWWCVCRAGQRARLPGRRWRAPASRRGGRLRVNSKLSKALT